MPKMTYEEMSAFLDDFFARLRRVRDAGQREYAQDDDNVFANFDRIAERLGSTREEVMMTYALKHVDGITAHVRGLQSQREGVLGRVKDLIMYLLLFAASETKAEAEAEAFFREGSLSRLFSSLKECEDVPGWRPVEEADTALAAGNAPRSPEKASDAVYGCLDAAGVHEAFESARERRQERDERARAKREARKQAQKQQHASDDDAGDGGGQHLRRHSAAEAAEEAACICVFDGGWRYDDNDCPRHGLPNQPMTTSKASEDDLVVADAYCGICQSFHPEPCDELHARWTPAPTGDAREVET